MSLQAPVFNIQSFSIHDGPGIRVTVFVKGCPLRCLWCANPESNLEKPQLMTYRGKCTGCGRCVPVCPQRAIGVGDDGKAQTNRNLCTDCGACAEVCPNEARELSGKLMTVDEVLEQVEKDRLFLESSGGGMTISGGECLMHPDFSAALLQKAQQSGLHTAVESCCFASRSTVDNVFRFVDLAIIDIKHMNSDVHKRLTGVPNEPILDNIRHIYHELHVPMMISLPVIPGYNDSEENIAATARFIADQLGTDVPLRLLPYHRLGEAKNESLGKTPDFSIDPPSDQTMQQLRELAASFGLQVQIGG